MTHDEIRDELARREGWTLEAYGTGHLWYPRGWPDCNEPVRSEENHPYPPTLDGANAAVPEGWTWNRWGCLYRGYHDGTVVKVNDHGRGHEMHDLYALALACVKAMEERK